jgi:hypothetical protein
MQNKQKLVEDNLVELYGDSLEVKDVMPQNVPTKGGRAYVHSPAPISQWLGVTGYISLWPQEM